VPDVTVEVRPQGDSPQLYVFDPKYKLDSDQESIGNGSPKKEDIDKMHAYRDALRGQHGERVVRYAAILYPGPEVSFSAGDHTPEIAALSANPEQPGALKASLRQIFERALA